MRRCHTHIRPAKTMATQPSEAAGGTSASKPAASKPTAGRQRGAQEMLTAAAVAVAAFLMPSEDASAIFRVVSAVLALAALFAASVCLELYQESKAKQEAKAGKNMFEVQTMRLELPPKPPGGVFGAARGMPELLKGYPVTTATEVKLLDHGFLLTSATPDGTRRLRVRLLGGDAVGGRE